jgi:hypothetical protein
VQHGRYPTVGEVQEFFMADRFSGLRCHPGDLAFIVQDEPECRTNIGQIVRVVGEYISSNRTPMFYWLVEPQSSTPSAVLVGKLGSNDCELVYDNDPRAHQDAWLRPLRVTGQPKDMALTTELPIQSEWKDPAHLRVT